MEPTLEDIPYLLSGDPFSSKAGVASRINVFTWENKPEYQVYSIRGTVGWDDFLTI